MTESACMEKREHPLSRKTEVISGKRTNCLENVWINEECKQTPRKRGRGENSCVGKLTYSMWENVQLFKSSALFLCIKGRLSRFILGCIYMEKR